MLCPIYRRPLRQGVFNLWRTGEPAGNDMLQQQTQEETFDNKVYVAATTETQTRAGSFPLRVAAENEALKQALQIKRMRRKLSRRSFLPLMDAYWENPGPLDAEKFSAVLAALCNPAPHSWREQMLCAWLLGHAPLTSEQQAEAARELGKVARNRYAPKGEQFRAPLRMAGMWSLPCSAVGAAAITLQVFIPSIINKPMVVDIWVFLFMSVVTFFALLIPVFGVLACLEGIANVHRLNRVRIAAILALARLQTPYAVGSLARATLNAIPAIRSVAEESLRVCLPQITSEHYARLDADTVPALCRLLNVKKERLFANHAHTEQLVLGVLEALGKIGDGSAVRPVESVAEDGWTDAVRNMARDILPILRERQQQENDPRLLLRGSTPPQTGSYQLLRPTSDTSHTPPEQLLRPENRE